MPRTVKRAVTAAVEYAVARAGFAAVRALDHDVIGQAHHPRGAAGRVTAWEMAHRPSNRQRSAWVVSLLGVQPADQVLAAADAIPNDWERGRALAAGLHGHRFP